MRLTPARRRRGWGMIAAVGLAAGLLVWPAGLASTPAAAAPVGPDDFRISDMGPASTAGHPALRSNVAYNPVTQQYLVVWEGGETDPFKAEIYGQLIDARTGAEVGANDFLIAGIGADATTDAVEPDVAYNSQRNEFVVVFAADDTVDAGGLVVDTFEISVQRVSAAGALLGGRLRVSDLGSSDSNGNFDARSPAVAYNATNDELLVVWHGDDDTPPLVNNELEIFGQLLGYAGGNLVETGANDVRLSDMGPDGNSGHDARNPAVAWNSVSNEYLVAWEGNDQTANAFPFRIHAQRVTAAGAETGGNDLLIGSTGDEGYTPAVAHNPTLDEYLVVWSGDDGAANTFNIHGQRLAGPTGAEVGGDTQISAVPGSTSQANTPAVAYSPVDNDYVVVWAGDNPSLGTLDDDYEVFSVRLSPTLATTEPITRISAMAGSTTSTQTPDVAVSDSTVRTHLTVWSAENHGPTVPGESEIWGELAAPAVDLTVIKQRTSPATAAPGDTVTYQVTYANASTTVTATGVVITDVVPAQLTNVSAVVSGTAVPRPATAFVWDVATLAPLASGTITITGTVTAGAADGLVVQNTATIATQAGTPDPSPGNNSATATFTVDRPPSVTINQAGGQADPTNTSPVQFTAAFSEAVTDFTALDVVLGGSAGPTTVLVTGGPTTYTVAVSGMTGPGSVTATIPAGAAVDSAGKPNLASTSTDNSVDFDATPPTVTVEQAAGQADPTNTAPVLFTASFSEAIDPATFVGSDVSLGGSANPTTAVVTGGPQVFTVTVSGMSGPGTVTASVPAGVVSDPAGNGNVASTSTDNSVTYDGSAPTLILEKASGQTDPTNASPVRFTATFSEAVSGFTALDVEVSGSAGADTVLVSGGPAEYTVSISGMTGDGEVTVAIPAGAAVDAAGNPSAEAVSADPTVVYDTTGPVVTVEKAAGQADPTNVSPILFALAVNEPVVGYNGLVDIEVTGPWQGLTLSSPGLPTTLTILPLADGTFTVTVPAGAFTDAAGNPNSVSVSTDNTVVYDTTAPTVTVEQAAGQADPTSGDTVTFAVEFSEVVTGFDDSDVVLGGAAGATTAVVSGSGSSYEVVVSGMTSSGTVTALVAAGAAIDAVGNLSAASTSTDNEVTLDLDVPSVTVEKAAGQADPTNVSPVVFTVTFSEVVTGFDATDLVVGGTAGATSATVGGSGAVYTVEVLGMSGSGTVTALVPAASAVDGADNPNLPSGTASLTYDAVGPEVIVALAPGQTATTGTAPVRFTITFDEPAPGLTTSDLIVAGTANPTAVALAGGPSVYTATIGDVERPGTVTLGVAAGVTTDATGNTNEASNVATVTIVDATGPIIETPPGGITVANDPGRAGATVTFTVTARDPGFGGTAPTERSGTPTPVTCTPASGSFFAIGATTVTCTATDPAGNSTTATFVVTVNDTERPAITGARDQTIALAAGLTSGPAGYAPPTATDNSGDVALVCTPAPDSTFGVGTTPVTCVATDRSGNTASASFAVTVTTTSTPPVELPDTGGDIWRLISAALVLFATGVVFIAGTRRRRRTT